MHKIYTALFSPLFIYPRQLITTLKTFTNAASCQLFSTSLYDKSSAVQIQAVARNDSVGRTVLLSVYTNWNGSTANCGCQKDQNRIGIIALTFAFRPEQRTYVLITPLSTFPNASEDTCNYCPEVESRRYFYLAHLPDASPQHLLNVGFEFRVTTYSPQLQNHTQLPCKCDSNDCSCSQSQGLFLSALFSPSNNCTFLQIRCKAAEFYSTICLLANYETKG